MNPFTSVRVRFAPSPTGALHIGGARTALFNFLFAKHHKGTFLLRIEDTDLTRSDQTLTEEIIHNLQWLGLEWNEPVVYQSAHTQRHREVCRELVEREWAYPCFCTPDELKAKRDAAHKVSGDYRYNRICLGLSKSEVQDRLNRKVPHTIRLLVPVGETTFHDAVRGTVTVQNKEIDDFIILRSDRSPVYQVAVVVDDYDMGITHVIRGDDHLSNTPKQVLIYRAMGWPVPEFAHVPMILSPDKKRLSKRHGSTSVDEVRSAGILPETLVNFLTLLGWSPGDGREMMSLEEIVDCFSLDRVSKNPAIFDETKLTWMNGQYIQRISDDQLLQEVSAILVNAGLVNDKFIKKEWTYILRFSQLLKERVKKLTDFSEKGYYFFKDPDTYEEKAVKKHWLKEGVVPRLKAITDALENQRGWTEEILEKTIRDLSEKMKIGAGKLIHPIRITLTGSGASPGLFEMMEVLGKERVIRRLKKAIDYLMMEKD